METGAELIAKERQRQIEQEGWTAQHDEQHNVGQLAMAAACYAFDVAAMSPEQGRRFVVDHWPWERIWWKPTPNDPIRQLVKAGALIAAEIDRLRRQEAQSGH